MIRLPRSRVRLVKVCFALLGLCGVFWLALYLNHCFSTARDLLSLSTRVADVSNWSLWERHEVSPGLLIPRSSTYHWVSEHEVLYFHDLVESQSRVYELARRTAKMTRVVLYRGGAAAIFNETTHQSRDL